MSVPTIPFYPVTHEDGRSIVSALQAITNVILDAENAAQDDAVSESSGSVPSSPYYPVTHKDGQDIIEALRVLRNAIRDIPDPPSYNEATESEPGLMSSSDKAKLNGIENNANKYVLPTAGGNMIGGVKTTSGVTDTAGLTPSPIINGVVYYGQTVYNDATSNDSGLMSSSDKRKLEAFQSAEKYALKSDLDRLYKIKASVVTFDDLPLEGNTEGDTRNVLDTGKSYVWLIDEQHPEGYWESFGNAVDSDGLITDAEREKLSGIEANANNYSLPTASRDNIGGVMTGSDVTDTDGLTPSPIIDGVVYYNGRTYSPASESEAGLMSSEDKIKLDGISDNANNYTLPTAGVRILGGVKSASEVTDVSGYSPSPIIDGVVYHQNTTYGNATSFNPGLMSVNDKKKLDGFLENGNYALKSDIERMYKIRPSVASYDDLPLTGNSEGDSRSTLDTGASYVWVIDESHPNGFWDEFGTNIDIESLTNDEIDQLCTL